MKSPPRIYILSDGGLPALVCMAIARDKAVAASVGSDRISYPTVLAFPPELWSDRIRMESITAQCETLQLALGTRQALSATTAGASDAEIEAGALMAAAFAAARSGASQLIWPATAGIGSTVDVQRACAIQDLAVLVSRIVSMDHADHGHPEFIIETPLADCSDDRVADLAVDLAVPVKTCWWNRPEAPLSAGESDRWERALRAVGSPLNAD